MKVYIAGAITNNPSYLQQFADAEKHLTAVGHAVINPVKNDGFSYKEYIDMGLCELMRCDAIYLLPGWEGSAGARLEHLYSVVTGRTIMYAQPAPTVQFSAKVSDDTLAALNAIGRSTHSEV